MPKGRIGLSLSEDVLAILNLHGRPEGSCGFRPTKSDAETCRYCSKPRTEHSLKLTRTQIIEDAIRCWDALLEIPYTVQGIVDRLKIRPEDGTTDEEATTRQGARSNSSTGGRTAKARSWSCGCVEDGDSIITCDTGWCERENPSLSGEAKGLPLVIPTGILAEPPARSEEEEQRLADIIMSKGAKGKKRERKAAGVNPDRIIEQQPGTYCPKHRPKYCAPDCPHRVSA